MSDVTIETPQNRERVEINQKRKRESTRKNRNYFFNHNYEKKRNNTKIFPFFWFVFL
jgi:hypothetical protein